MINFNTVYKAEAQPNREYTIIPKGTYRAKITKVDDWKVVKSKKDIKVKATEEVLPIGTEIATLNYYVEICEEINKGYNGRQIRGSITTHPNMPWSIPAFLDGIDVKECSLNDIKNLALNKVVNAYIITEDSTRTVINPETGLEEQATKVYNKVASIRKPNIVGSDEEDF